MRKPKVLVLPTGKLQEQLFPEPVRERLAHFADPVYNEKESLSSEELADRLPGFQAVVTGWGSPKLTPEVLDAADRLGLVAHAAGSVRSL
ncbi:MAG: hydroxyacid dehydrogenase, partial [Thermoleophilia bacterium]|nr:hydroxyacid dehydrogenase [Thermoleophilia bacterium]